MGKIECIAVFSHILSQDQRRQALHQVESKGGRLASYVRDCERPKADNGFGVKAILSPIMEIILSQRMVALSTPPVEVSGSSSKIGLGSGRNASDPFTKNAAVVMSWNRFWGYG